MKILDRNVCPECQAPDCGENLGIYLCGSKGTREWGSFCQSEICKGMVKSGEWIKHWDRQKIEFEDTRTKLAEEDAKEKEQIRIWFNSLSETEKSNVDKYVKYFIYRCYMCENDWSGKQKELSRQLNEHS